MTFTYDPTNDIGKVRRIAGLTVEDESEISDEEIQAWLDDVANNHESAAMRILRQLAAIYAKRANVTSGNEKIENGNVSSSYLLLAADIERSLGISGSTLTSKRVTRV